MCVIEEGTRTTQKLHVQTINHILLKLEIQEGGMGEAISTEQ